MLVGLFVNVSAFFFFFCVCVVYEAVVMLLLCRRVKPNDIIRLLGIRIQRSSTDELEGQASQQPTTDWSGDVLAVAFLES